MENYTQMKIFLLFIPIIFTACASVSLYEDKDFKRETGLKFYHSKPYLLVEKSFQKDVKIKSTIIYLPDLENPTYAKIKSGFGKAELKVGLENSILKSYGFTADNKIPETIGSLTKPLTSVTEAYKTIAEAIEIREETEKQSTTDKPKDTRLEWELYEILISGGKTKLIKVEFGKQ